jgi:hypothetical protein
MPRYLFGPEVSAWAALGMLARERADISTATGEALPYFYGFDTAGQFRFEALDTTGLSPVMSYSDADPGGEGQIIGELRVLNSTAEMRSDIAFEGIDARTGAEFAVHITQPEAVRQAVGFYYPWQERSPRFAPGAEGSLPLRALAAARVASYPQQTVQFLAAFLPWVYAGQKVLVSEQKSLGGTGEFLITALRSRYGMCGVGGIRESISEITARRIG